MNSGKPRKNSVLLLMPFSFLLIFSFFMQKSSQAQTLADAIRLTENEQYEAAGELYRIVGSKDPANAAIYYYMGENYLLSDKPDSALFSYEAGERADANNPLLKIGRAKYNLDRYSVAEKKKLLKLEEANLARAQAAYDALPVKTPDDEVKLNEAKVEAKEAEVKYNEAVALVKEADAFINEAIIKAGPKNALVYQEAADALVRFKNKDLDKAKTLLDKAYALQPRNADVLILYGDIYSELNNGSLAADYYNKALDVNPKSARSMVNKGRLYKRSTNFEGAAEEFRRAIQIDEGYAPAHRELGEVYYKLGKLEDAKKEYRRYLELSKNNCGARVRYASFLFVSKDFKGAMEELAQLKNCAGDNITALRISAFSAYELKDSARSLTNAKLLFSKIREDKINSYDYEYYGKALSLNNRDSAAAIYIYKAYELDNSRCDLLNEMARINEKIKNYPEAARILEEKRQNCKGFTVADYFNLGRAYFFSRGYAKADSAFARVNELSPKYASGFLWRAKANANIDTTSVLGMAKPFYEKYIEVALADSASKHKYRDGLMEAYRYLASYYYFQQKDQEKTKDALRRILEIDPEDKDARDGLKRIDFDQKQGQKKP